MKLNQLLVFCMFMQLGLIREVQKIQALKYVKMAGK